MSSHVTDITWDYHVKHTLLTNHVTQSRRQGLIKLLAVGRQGVCTTQSSMDSNEDISARATDQPAG